MLRFPSIRILVIIYLFVCQRFSIECRTLSKNIIIQDHQWTVPNEPGWEEVIKEVEPIRQELLANCTTSRECRLAIERLRQIFLKYPVSSKYYENPLRNDEYKYDSNSVFKWG